MPAYGEDGRSAILEIGARSCASRRRPPTTRAASPQRGPDPWRLGRQRNAGRIARSMSTCACPACSSAEEMTRWFRTLEPIGKEVELTVEGAMDRPTLSEGRGHHRSLPEGAGDLSRDRQGTERRAAEAAGGGGGAGDGNFTAALGIPTLDGLAPTAGRATPSPSRSIIRPWSRDLSLHARRGTLDSPSGRATPVARSRIASFPSTPP